MIPLKQIPQLGNMRAGITGDRTNPSDRIEQRFKVLGENRRRRSGQSVFE